MSKFNVADQVVIERRVGESEDWLRDVGTGSLNWDIVVLLEVDAGLLLGWIVSNTEQLTLHAEVCGSSNVLAILPLSVAAATSRGRSATGTTSTWVTISVAVESLWLSVVVPSASSAWGRSSGTWSEVRGVGPVSGGARSITCESVSAWGSTLAGHQ